MSAETKTRPQDVTVKSVSRATYFQSLAISVLATGVLTCVASWFMWTNVHDNARQAVVSDMGAVSKVRK